MEWEEIKTKDPPVSRNHHTSIASEGGVYSFGGRGTVLADFSVSNVRS